MQPPEDHWNLRTRLIHSHPYDKSYAAVVPAVYRATTYHQADPYHPGPYDYARSGNPTRHGFEQAMAGLEGGIRGFAFSSGMAALTAFFLLFKAGDHLLVTADCQGGTQRVLRGVFQRFGLSVTYVDTDHLDQVRDARRPETVALLVENFSNPFLRVSNVPELSQWAHDSNLLLAVDNTFITPYLQNPLMMGADMVIHSATKMIGGHSDLTAGIAVVREEKLASSLYFIQNACGSILSPDDSYLAHRGLQTLAVRMSQASRTAERLATYLADQLGHENVWYPGLASHPGHDLVRRQMRGFGQMLTFTLGRREDVQTFVSRLRIASVGAGFGGTETMISLPEMHCHAALTPEEREARHLGGNIVRVSVGLESGDDLLNEFNQALEGLS